jgi:hypothetical protein
MSANPDISEELAALRVIGANLHETLMRMAEKLSGSAEVSVGLTLDLSNSLLGHIERCDPPIRTSRVKSRPPHRAGGAGYYVERPVVAVAEVSAKFVAYGVNAEGSPDMRQMVPDMRRSVWDLPPANYQPRVDAKNRN